MSFLVNSNDNQVHRLALYFCDWNNQNRSVRVEALDASTQQVLATGALGPTDSYLEGRPR